MFKIAKYIVFILLVLLASCNDNAKSEMSEVTFNVDTNTYVTDENFLKTKNPAGLFEELEKSLPKMNIDSVNYYVVEGDVLLDKDKLYYYSVSQFKAITDSIRPQGPSIQKFTVGVRPDGSLAIWQPNYVIRYAVLKKSFSSINNYLLAVQNVQKAAADWMGICNVKFEYMNNYDGLMPGSDLHDDLTFVVREFNAGGQFIAQSFFPGDPPYERRLLIDPSYYTTTVSKTGILRHELGHIIGCRHEHIRSKDSDCSGENIIEGYMSATYLTDYDRYSVMHYLCGGVGDPELKFTAFDSAGARKLYGPPILN